MQDGPCTITSSVAVVETRIEKAKRNTVEIIKNVYRGCLLTVTIVMCLCMFKVGCEIATLNKELVKTRVAAEKAANVAQEYGNKILAQIEVIKKNGFKIRVF